MILKLVEFTHHEWDKTPIYINPVFITALESISDRGLIITKIHLQGSFVLVKNTIKEVYAELYCKPI